jgi:hypothetical protein
VLETKNVRHIKRHADKPLVPKPWEFEFKMVTGNLKRNKSPGTDQIQAELLQSGKGGGGQCNSKHQNLLIILYFLLGNSPVSEFQKAENYTEESIQHSENGETYEFCLNENAMSQ